MSETKNQQTTPNSLKHFLMKVPMSPILLFVLSTLIFTSCTKEPKADDVKLAVSAQMPNYVSVININLSESKNVGTSDQPIWKGNFQAKIEFDEDILTKDREKSDVIFLDLVKKAHDTMTFSGRYITKLLSDKGWNTTIELNDDFQMPPGKPARDWPSKRKVVNGTPDEGKYHADKDAEEKKLKELEEQRKANAEAAWKADQEFRNEKSRKTNNP